MSIASPAGSARLPSSPFIRGSIRSATTHDSQTVVPSSRRSETTPLAPRRPGRAAASLATECPEEEEEGGPEQDDEHGREDQQHEREQDLDRRLLCLFLRRLPPAPAHLERE